MLKKVAGNDLDQYNKLMEKCINKSDIIKEYAYQIDVEGFMCYKNHIYVPNQTNLKQIIFKELHDNPCATHPKY